MNPPSTATPWSSRQRILFLIFLAAGLGWSGVIMFVSPGWSLDDELSHYIRSRSVWENPVLIFDSWTRFGRNVFHVLPAHFGLTVARLWTLAFAGLAVVFTAVLARRLGAKHAWLIPLLLCFQPWFAELSWGVLTQTPFMVTWVAGILCFTMGRPVLSGLCFGVLPLIRHEGIALTGLWVALLAGHTLLTRGSWRVWLGVAMAAALPTFVYNASAWVCLGDFPSRIFLSAKPTEIYGHGTLWHFLPISFRPAGVATVILGAIGLPLLCHQWKISWPLIVYPAYLALHSVVYWQGLFASGGYYHFLMPMAPGVAIAAVFGIDWLLEKNTRASRIAAGGLVAASVLQGLLMIHLWRGFTEPRFLLYRDPITSALDSAIEWQKKERPEARPVICHHIYMAFREDWIETIERRQLDSTRPAELPVGTVAIWEEKYSDLTNLPLADFESQSDWQERASFGDGSVRIFEKVAPR